MRKNRMMRAASALLVAVLLTTSTISGTFAKYVTTDNAEDSARVAKWGVVVTAGGSLFEDTYKDAPTDVAADQTVVAVDSKDVVAPGTNNTDDVFKFSIVGKPEVDVKVEITVENVKDVFLKSKTGLPKMTTGDIDDTFDLGSDYYPVQYTLTKTTKPNDSSAGVTTTLVDAGKLSDVVTELNNIANAKIDANTDLGVTYGEYELSWKWDYESAKTNNDADTLLGDLAANTELTPVVALTNGTDYNLETGLKFTITVTQVD